MKTAMTKLTGTFTRMKKAIGRAFDAYDKALLELRGTPAFINCMPPMR